MLNQSTTPTDYHYNLHTDTRLFLPLHTLELQTIFRITKKTRLTNSVLSLYDYKMLAFLFNVMYRVIINSVRGVSVTGKCVTLLLVAPLAEE